MTLTDLLQHRADRLRLRLVIQQADGTLLEVDTSRLAFVRPIDAAPAIEGVPLGDDGPVRPTAVAAVDGNWSGRLVEPDGGDPQYARRGEQVIVLTAIAD